jgi:catechol 2,3-dioxygenase-like lactoylglutathione lyase family enzyme
VRLTVFTLFVNDQDQALRFYVGRLGFVVPGGQTDGRLPMAPGARAGNPGRRDQPGARPHAGPAGPRWESGRWQTLFALATDNCRDFQAMTARASP